MRRTVYDLHQCFLGERIKVTLQGNRVNMRLMDLKNYMNCRAGKSCKYYGGLVKQSPIILSVPSSGHWYLIVDLQGLEGSVRTSIEKLSFPLPFYLEPDLPSVPSLMRNFIPIEKSRDKSNIDVFILYMSEDKDEILRVH